MNPLRSNRMVKEKRMAGARALWRASGMKESQFGRPIIAVVNSFTQFVPGHTHLHNTGQLIKKIIEENGCYAAEFNTIAIDDGIAMGHEGMLYSLPSRELIADSIEYMCNAHCVDGLIAISNCDKITPGMLMAMMRLNIPSILVSGGVMEAGKSDNNSFDLVDIMVGAADKKKKKSELLWLEKNACPTCGSCSGMFTANSMNCLAEALGLAPIGNGTLLATHKLREELISDAAELIVKKCEEYYFKGNNNVLPRSIATREAFCNAMTMDIAMGGSTNTILHLLAIAHEAGVKFSMADIEHLSKNNPVLCQVSPNGKYHIEDVNRAGGVMRILGELSRAGKIDLSVCRVDYRNLEEALKYNDIKSSECSDEAKRRYLAAPGGIKSREMGSQESYYTEHDLDSVNGCIRDYDNAYRNDGGLAVLYGNVAQNGSIIKTAGTDASMMLFTGKAIVFESQEEAIEGILHGKVQSGDVVVIRYEGPAGGPGMQEMLYPTSYLKSMNLDKCCALITDGRFSGGSSGLSIGHISPEAAAGGNIALIENGDLITVNIPERSINVELSENELNRRRDELIKQKAGKFSPEKRERKISNSLKAYSVFVSSADKGAIRVFN